MDIGPVPHLHVALLYLYPFSSGLFSFSLSEEQGQREERVTDTPYAHAQSPAYLLSECLCALSLAYEAGAKSTNHSSPQETQTLRTRTSEARPGWATGFKGRVKSESSSVEGTGLAFGRSWIKSPAPPPPQQQQRKHLGDEKMQQNRKPMI